MICYTFSKTWTIDYEKCPSSHNDIEIVSLMFMF